MRRRKLNMVKINSMVERHNTQYPFVNFDITHHVNNGLSDRNSWKISQKVVK